MGDFCDKIKIDYGWDLFCIERQAVFMNITGIRTQGVGYFNFVKSRNLIPETDRELPVAGDNMSLQQENQRLKQELLELKNQINLQKQEDQSQSRIEFDIDKNIFKMQNIRTQDLLVDRLEVKVQGGDQLVKNMVSLDQVLNPQGIMPPDLQSMLNKNPLEVENFRLRIPQDSASRALVTVGGEEMLKEGISQTSVKFLDNDRLQVSGKMKKIINIPFQIGGKLSMAEDGRIKFGLESMNIGGLIPLPKLIRHLIMGIAQGNLSEQSIERQGDSFLLSPQTFVPENIRVNLSKIGTQDGCLLLEGGKPER